MASVRAPFINYYEVLAIPRDHPQLRDALIEKQSAILTSPSQSGPHTNQELIKMILILLDPIKGPQYDYDLSIKLAAQCAMEEARQDQERKEQHFAAFLADKETLMIWFFEFCKHPHSPAILHQFEYAEMKKNPVGFHLDKSFTCEERIALSEKIAGMLAADFALLDKLLSSIRAGFEIERLEYIWKLLDAFFADTKDYPALLTRLRLFILAEKFKDDEDEKTSLVYPSPQSFWLVNEIFKTSPTEHAEALTALYKTDCFLATIKSYYNASILPRKVREVVTTRRVPNQTVFGHGKDEIYKDTKLVEDPYIPTLLECFKYLPDKGEALGLMILNNQAALSSFGIGDTFWKNFPAAIQERVNALVKTQQDATIIHSNVKIKEYLEEINLALSEYHISKVNEQAALEDNSGLFAKARVSLFSKEDSRGLLRVKVLMNLFNDAAASPVRTLILMLAVLTNTDSKKLRGKIAEKVKEQAVIDLLTQRLRIIHGHSFSLNVTDLKAKVLDPLNEKTNHPPVKADETPEHQKLFAKEMEMIKQLESTGSLQTAPEMKMG